MLQIEAVTSRRDLTAFIRLPRALYRDDPHHVAPLEALQRMQFGRHNPYFQHAQWQAWVARREGRVLGRISAQLDELYTQTHGAPCGHFGLLETVDEPEVSGALLAAAENWLRARGVALVRGPFNLSINEECGLLVDGYEFPPVFLMGHARPYYPAHLAAAGYLPAKDLLAYRVNLDYPEPAASVRLIDGFAGQLTDRPFDRRHWRADLATMRELFNDAWAANWGYVPFTAPEFAGLAPLVRFLVPSGQVRICSYAGEPVGMIAALPNLNELIADLRGRLLPTGWLKLLWRLARTTPRGARVALMGIAQRHQRTPLGAAIAFLMIRNTRAALRAQGYDWVEMSWILEDNRGMRRIIEALGSDCYKRYRIYEKTLA